MALSSQALLLLDRLERVEASLLAWGVIDGALSRSDIDEAAEQVIGHDVSLAEGLVHELANANLLLKGRSDHAEEIFRTRMAETVRLAASLRQLFETNAGSAWRGAPRLVGDYRFSVRSRRYPARALTIEDVLARVNPASIPSEASENALRALLALAGGPDSKHATFQADATDRILEVLNGTLSTGTVISAGTGSGKTLAFYAPAFAFLATELERDPTPWTKVVAIYPRNELLKDQFAQAYAAARAVDDLLPSERRVTIGAYFGLAPRQLDSFNIRSVRWRQEAGGWLCPYMRCPLCGEDSLVWTEARPGLTCHRSSCGEVVTEHDVALSRDAISRRPPDILFTTTEMLNRGLCSSWTRPVFGVGRDVRAPQAILLDEVHTYGGLHGAAVALLLRRYRYALHSAVQLVGLSATLRDAQQFFGGLTGLPSTAVATISPADEDMIEEGAEYLLALRADPTSGRSVLSTTIQTAMLVRRMLEPWDEDRSDGAAGRRVFLFTDKLDLANRLFFDLRDAEGQTDRGFPAPWRTEGSLANLRSTKYAREHGGDANARDVGGQLWRASEDIGFRLQGSNLLIERTTSQDAGVDPRADVVVATASLDVGFNDPEAGAVIQHKAPRRNSQFLQRRGRAGRVRKMRPWTVVSLSDFGRDRVAYEGYDLLFDPELEPQPLPVDNRHVQRMQATYALLEWLELRIGQRGSMWRDLAGPPRKRDGTLNLERWAQQAPRRTRTIQLLEELLLDPTTQRSLATHVSEALNVEEDDVQRLLWDPPRALLTAVVPTALRRLNSCWATADGSHGTDFELPDHPLPEFVPRSLFQSLNTPDVLLRIPADGTVESEALGIDTTLREYCPGNVSQRLGHRRRRDRHWVPTPDLVRGVPKSTDITDWITRHEELGDYPLASNPAERIRVLRPLTVDLKVVPRTVKSSSAAFPIWNTNIAPEALCESVDLSAEHRWNSIIRSIDFFTHSAGAGVEVCRFMIGAHASRITDVGASEGEVTFVRSVESGNERVALGYEAEVDAVRLRFSWSASEPLSSRLPDTLMRSIKVGLFLHAVETDPTLGALTSNLGRRQLGELYLTALVSEACANGVDLERAAPAIRPDLAERLIAIADQQGSVLRLDEDDLSAAHLAQSGVADARRSLDRLEALLRDFPEVCDRLAASAETLWRPNVEDLERFVRRRYAATIGAAFLLAFQRMCPDVDLEQVVVDVDAHVESDRPDDLGEIWLTETTAGGGGVIEEVSREALKAPRRLMRFVEGALAASDLELIDAELLRALELAEEEPAVSAALDAVRGAIGVHEGVTQSREALVRLLRSLAERGVLISHPVVSAIAARLLRPGTSSESDLALLRLRRQWAAEEERLEIDLPLRAFAFAAAADGAGASADFARVTLGTTEDSSSRYGLLTTVLWPRGDEIRSQALPAPNYFSSNPDTDRRLLVAAMPPSAPPIDAGADDWRDAVDDALVNHGEAHLRAPRGDGRRLREALLTIAAQPSDVGFLHLYPSIFGGTATAEHVEVALLIRELEA